MKGVSNSTKFRLLRGVKVGGRGLRLVGADNLAMKIGVIGIGKDYCGTKACRMSISGREKRAIGPGMNA